MKGIAEGYLDIDNRIIKKLLEENKDDPEAFNRDIFVKWADRNPGDERVKVCQPDCC